MSVCRNIVARSPNLCYNGKATTRSVYVVESHYTVNGIKILGVAQQCFYIAGNNKTYHHHHVQEGLGLIPVPCILKIKLVPPSLPRSSYVSSSFWFILQCLFLVSSKLTLRRLMSYIYMEHPFLLFLDHTQRRSTVGRTPLDE